MALPAWQKKETWGKGGGWGGGWGGLFTPKVQTEASGSSGGNVMEIPMDIYPHSEGTQQSVQQSFTGLPGWRNELIKETAQYWTPKTMNEYGGLLSSFQSPESYMARFDPYRRAITDEMASRGLVGGDVMGRRLAEAGTQQYAQDQAVAMNAYQQMINSLNSMLQGARYSQASGESYGRESWEDPSVLLRELLDIAGGMQT